MVATPEEDATGLTQAIAGWEAALSALTDLQTSLHGRANPLGLDPGFLMLADRVTVDSVNHFDSFDSFAAQLDPDASTSPLAIALEDLQQARGNYAAYRGYEDQWQEQIDESSDAFELRLFEIVGALPGTPNYSNNPTNNFFDRSVSRPAPINQSDSQK